MKGHSLKEDYIAYYSSPLGNMTLASDGTALTGLWFDGQRHFADTLKEVHTLNADLPVFDQTCQWLDIYFSGKEPTFTPPLLIRGSTFRKQVWQLLLEIPYGRTMTYGEIARKLQCMSAQAVGGAVGHNPISIIIPCHRVIGSDGSLTGYAGGVELKASLLKLELYEQEKNNKTE